MSEDGTNHWHLFFWIEDVAHQTTYIPETHSYIHPYSKRKSIRDFSCLPPWFHCNYYKIVEVIFKTPFCNFNYFIDVSNNLRSEEIWTTIATHNVNFSSKIGSLFSCLTLVWLDAWRALSGISPTCMDKAYSILTFSSSQEKSNGKFKNFRKRLENLCHSLWDNPLTWPFDL